MPIIDVSHLVSVILGGCLAVLGSYLSANRTAKINLEITKLNAEKDSFLLIKRQQLDTKKEVLKAERDKLEELMRILHKINYENSQTMSHFQNWDKNIINFRERYNDNNELLFQAMAITALYLPDKYDTLRNIKGLANQFWGNQEHLMNIDSINNNDVWHIVMGKILGVCSEISKEINHISAIVIDKGSQLSKELRNLE